ncbi:MAG TPA: CAP domain-containing protein [Polyangiales bacterium]|nr:CAP domain-containing protein [Polyangiales bacterium]
MSRTTFWFLWLGFGCLSALGGCSPDDGDGRSSNAPIQIPTGGAAGASGSTVGAQAGVSGSTTTGAGQVGRPAGAPAPIVAGAPAPIGPAGAGAIGGGAAGTLGTGGMIGAAGAVAAGRGSAGTPAAAGSGSAGMLGTAGTAGTAGTMSMATMGETGRMVGMTAAHNAVRAMVQTMPPLAPLTWSPTLAAYAQEWADNEAKTACNRPMHRSQQELQAKRYGENLAAAGGVPAPMTNAQWAVDGWAGEVKCWTYGTSGADFGGTEKCDMACYTQMRSDGCGHYTAIVWRNTTEVGCGVSTCQAGGATWDIWICNYSPPGNVVGQKPY